MEKFQLEHTSGQWMFFTVSSKFTLKTMFLHKGKKSLLTHWLKNNITETNGYLQGMLQNIRYLENRLDTCADLHVTAML